VPDRTPEKPLNTYPEAGIALTLTLVPVLYQALAGLMVPPAVGLATVVK
jgi:hypothetical protein